MVIAPKMAHVALQYVDALFRGEGVRLPSTVILDYLYGLAAYKAWHSDDSFNQMKAYRNRYYASIPPLNPAPPEDVMDDGVSSGPDDPNDSYYKPPQPRKRYTPKRRSGLEEAMDELNMFLMYIHGITPEMAAERRQKEIEQEERAAQEASRSKVMKVEETSGRLLKCIYNCCLAIVLCALCLLYK